MFIYIVCVYVCRVRNSKFMPHGEKVVQYMMQHEGLLTLERLWRQHFIATMKPQFLPSYWSVDHSHERLKDIDSDMKQVLSHQTPESGTAATT